MRRNSSRHRATWLIPGRYSSRRGINPRSRASPASSSSCRWTLSFPGHYFHLRIVPVEAGVHVHKHFHPTFRGKGQGQGAPPLVRNIVDDAVCLVLHRQHLLGVVHINPSGLCQGEAAPGAAEQRGAQLVLQLEQLLIQGGLGDEQLGGRSADAPFLGNGDDIEHLLDIHECSLLTYIERAASPVTGWGRGRGRWEWAQRWISATATSLTLVPVAPVRSRPPHASRAW